MFVLTGMKFLLQLIIWVELLNQLWFCNKPLDLLGYIPIVSGHSEDGGEEGISINDKSFIEKFNVYLLIFVLQFVWYIQGLLPNLCVQKSPVYKNGKNLPA